LLIDLSMDGVVALKPVSTVVELCDCGQLETKNGVIALPSPSTLRRPPRFLHAHVQRQPSTVD